MNPVRQALAALYSGNASSDAERHAADTWLRTWAGQEGAWQALLQLLADPAAAEHERFFAATSLRPLCFKAKPLTAADAAPAAMQLLAQQYAVAAATGSWHIANPLAAALAALALRTCTREAELLPGLLGLLQQSQSSSSNGLGQQRQLQQQVAAQLHLLTALAEAAASRDVSMHPQRREAAQAALVAAPEPLAAVQQALGSGSADAAAVAAALQLLQAWCVLGPPPAGADGTQAASLWQQLHQAALQPGLGSAAAEALAALYATCGGAPAPHGGSDGAAAEPAELTQRRRGLLSSLLGLLPGFGQGLQQALAQAPSAQAQAQLLFAGLTILGAAAAAADACALGWQGGRPPAAAAEAVQLAAELALAALQHRSFDATLAALQHFDEQLERWKAQPHGSSGACSPEQQQALLERLCGALLQRMALPPHLPAAFATADARDLPDDIVLVRREVADTFRAAADALGPAATRQHLLRLAAEAQAAWQAGGGWQQYECALYALNLVWSRQRAQQQDEAAAAEAAAAAAAAAAALQPAAPKLAGTALTLLGGMAEQLVLLEQAQLQQLLELLVQLVRLPGDDKLSRNAATCCHRLAGCHPLAARLAAGHPGFSAALCTCFAAGGGMRQRAQHGDDLSTEQFLLAAVCRLAAAVPAVHDGSSGGSGGELLLQLLLQPAAAAQAALAAAAAAGSTEQQLLLLQQAAVQVETIAVALEAASSTGDAANSLAQQLPAVLNSLGSLLQRAAAAAAVAAQQQQQQQQAAQQEPQLALLLAVCRLAAAVAPTPAAAMALDLLGPFVASPPHPCVLSTLTELAGSQLGSSSSSAALLQAAISGSIQAAAALHAADPDWQPALLQLGSGSLRWLPSAVADGPTFEALLALVQHSMQSYHRDVCEQVLPFVEALCCIGTAAAPAGAPGGCDSAAAAAARQHLQQRLDGGGLGAALVLGLLLAAAGAMPPYTVVWIADALHRTWRATGQRFEAWLRDAVLVRAPADAPWRRWKPEAAAAAVADLLSPACAQDARRFKRLLKVLCGGKKKGAAGDPPARGAS